MFKFDPARFQKQLEDHHLIHMDNFYHSPGMFRIFDYVFTHMPTKRIDFNMFTREEMELVLEDANNYDCSDDYGLQIDDEEDGPSHTNWGNSVHEYLRCIDIQNNLHHTKEKIFEEEDDFL
jgi:hypothetical protein